ncbi:MAG: transglycosylase domain-containing protein [Kiritimatiellia bacterium]
MTSSSSPGAPPPRRPPRPSSLLALASLRSLLSAAAFSNSSSSPPLALCIAWFAFPRSPPASPRSPRPAASSTATAASSASKPVSTAPSPSRPLDQTSPWLAKAIIAAEDKRFETHPGIDPLAIARAVTQNASSGRVISGASTLSTQVMRMTRPQQRTLAVKAEEALHALQMETRLTKPEILSQYLNRAPFGGNLAGVEAAARAWFGKSAAQVSLAEAALLMGLPQSPGRLRPDRNPEGGQVPRLRPRPHGGNRRHHRGSAGCGRGHPAVDIPLRAAPFARGTLCDLPPCAPPPRCRALHPSTPAQAAVAEHALRAHLEKLAPRGIHGGAVIIVDVPTSPSSPLAASPDYFDARHAGQVNGADARAPRLHLKPFVYLRFGRPAHPDSVVADVSSATPAMSPPISTTSSAPSPSAKPSSPPQHSRPQDPRTDRPRHRSRPPPRRRPPVPRPPRLPLRHQPRPRQRRGHPARTRRGLRRPRPTRRAPPSVSATPIPTAPPPASPRPAPPGSWPTSCPAPNAPSRPAVTWPTPKARVTHGRPAPPWGIATPGPSPTARVMSSPSDRQSPMVAPPTASPASRPQPLADRIFRQLDFAAKPRGYPRPRRPHPPRSPPLAAPPVPTARTPAGSRPGRPHRSHPLRRPSDPPLRPRRRPPPKPADAAPRPRRLKAAEVWPPEVESWRASPIGNERPGGSPLTSLTSASLTSVSRPPTSSLHLRIPLPPPPPPVRGVAYRFLPGDDSGRQRLELKAAASAGSELFWFVNGERVARVLSGESAWWLLAPGRHTIACADPTGLSRSIDIEVE